MTEDTTRDEDPFRIAPDLEERIEADAMNQKAEYVFVKQMTPHSDNGDLVEVKFALPYGDQTFDRTFARDPVSQQYDTPSLAQLYEASDGATLDQPRSILETSIPIDADKGYSLDIPPEQRNPKRINKTAVNDEVREIDLYPRNVTPIGEYVIPGAVGLLGLVLGFAVGGIGGFLTFVIFVFAGIILNLRERSFDVPAGARKVDDNQTIAANRGDLLILDKRNAVIAKQQRAVIEITGKDDGALVGDVLGGDTTVRVNPQTLRVHGPVSSDVYRHAYVIDRSSGEIVRTN